MLLYPYKMGRQIRHEGSRFKGAPRKTVINWGSSTLPEEVKKSRVLNPEAAVRVAGNKLSAFRVMKAAGVSVPAFTEDREEAIKWLEKGLTVVARKTLTGHSGAGIEILEKGLDFVEALCYTVYQPKSAEYRLHVMKNREGVYEVIDVQRKVKDKDRDVVDWKVRSHKNGFVFVRNNDADKSYKEAVEKPVVDQALKAIQSIGLDFAGIDVVWNSKKNAAYVLELNCACGLEGESVNVYANAFKNLAA